MSASKISRLNSLENALLLRSRLKAVVVLDFLTMNSSIADVAVATRSTTGSRQRLLGCKLKSLDCQEGCCPTAAERLPAAMPAPPIGEYVMWTTVGMGPN